MIIANILAYIIVLVGSLNWGLIGIFGWNLVGAIFGGMMAAGAMIIYILVFISAIWLIISTIISRGHLVICRRDEK